MQLVAGYWIIWAAVAAVGIAAKAFRRRAAARAAAAQAAAEEAQRREQQRRRAEAQRAAELKKQAAQEAKEHAARERERQQAEKAAARATRKQEQERRQAERLEAARQLAEYKERALQAEKALQALQHEKRPENIPAPAAVTLEQFAAVHPAKAPEKPRTFAGETVAFTGKLQNMTRAEAIALVQERGGRAFKTMPAGTTLLVVGKNPGMQKLDKADEWITQVKKITEAQFMERVNVAA